MTINNHFNRAGAKASAERQSIMHEARDHATQAAHRICASCGCSDCADVQGRLEGAPTFKGADDDTDRRQRPRTEIRQTGTIERSNAESLTDILDRLQAKGFLNSHQRQMAAAQLAVRPMFGNVKV